VYSIFKILDLKHNQEVLPSSIDYLDQLPAKPDTRDVYFDFSKRKDEKLDLDSDEKGCTELYLE